MPLTPQTKETAALAVTNLGSWVSLHTGDPGTSGASEATGGSYARIQTTWTAGSADGTVNGSQVTINVPIGTYTYFGLWSLSSGGTFIGSGVIASTTMAAAGQIKLTPVYVHS